MTSNGIKSPFFAGPPAIERDTQTQGHRGQLAQVGKSLSSSSPWRIINTESIQDLLSDWVIGKKPTTENGATGSERVQREEAGSGESKENIPFRYSQEVQDKPILMCDDSNMWPACQLSLLLRLWEKSYAGEGEDTKSDIIKEIKRIIDNGERLDDEFCLQILKQTNGNPNPLPLWDLFEKALEHLRLSEEIADFACDCFRQIVCSDDDNIVKMKVFGINNLMRKNLARDRAAKLEARRITEETLTATSQGRHSSIGSLTRSLTPIDERNPLSSAEIQQSAYPAGTGQGLLSPSLSIQDSTRCSKGNASTTEGNPVDQMEETPSSCGCFGIFPRRRSRHQTQQRIAGEAPAVFERENTVSAAGPPAPQRSQSIPESGSDRLDSQIQQLDEFAPGVVLNNRFTIQSVNDNHKERIRYAVHRYSHQEVVLKFYASHDEAAKASAFHQGHQSEYFCSLMDFFDLDAERYKHCIVYEKGTETLSDWMNVQHSDLEKRAVLRRVGKAVEFLHLLGYAHRDLKPDNIMKFGDKWKLIDFDSVSRIDEISNIAYTLKYAAPEVVRADEAGERKITVKSEHDMWSLGIIAYEVFSQGCRFYSGIQANQLKQFIATGVNKEYISERMAIVGERKERSLVEACLQLEPKDRIASTKYTTRAIFKNATEDTTTVAARQKQEEKELQYLRSQTVQGNVKINAKLKRAWSKTTSLPDLSSRNDAPDSDDRETKIFKLNPGENYQLIINLSLKSSEEVALFSQVVSVAIETTYGGVVQLPGTNVHVASTYCIIKAVIDGERIRGDILRGGDTFAVKLIIRLAMEVRRHEDTGEMVRHECNVESYLQCMPQRSSAFMKSFRSFRSSLSTSTPF